MTAVARVLYKSFDAELACPVTGMRWPAPQPAHAGEWVERAGPLDPEGLGFLVFRGDDLAPWASQRLFRVEVEGAIDAADPGVVVAQRVRLLMPEPSWSQTCRELGEFALARVNALAPSHPRLAEYAGDVANCVQYGLINGVLFVTAIAHAVAADLHGSDPAARCGAFARERALQSRFIAERLQA